MSEKEISILRKPIIMELFPRLTSGLHFAEVIILIAIKVDTRDPEIRPNTSTFFFIMNFLGGKDVGSAGKPVHTKV